MLSVTMLAPFAHVRTAAIWGCISVGKPGCGLVFMLVPKYSGPPMTLTASSNCSTCTPILTSFWVMGSRCFGITFLIRILLLAAAAIAMNVPASIWSGITL